MKAILFIGVIAAIVFFKTNVNLESFTNEFFGESSGGIISSGTNYTEIEQDSLKKQFQGFWEFSGRVSSNVYLIDILELKENGIVWEYETRIVNFPYGIIDTLYRVSNSYLLPYSPLDSTRSNCYLRLIHQNWEIDGSTCYGKSVELMESMFNATVEKSNILWAVTAEKKSDSTLNLRGNNYTRFDESRENFWGDRAWSAIETIQDISIPGCGSDDPHLEWMRNGIIEAIKTQDLSVEVVELEQKMNIKEFYAPLCLNRLEIDYGASEGKNIIMELTISDEGAVVDVVLSGEPVEDTFRRELLTNEIKKWLFTSIGEEKTISVSVPAVTRQKAIFQKL